MFIDHYMISGLEPDASPEDVQQRYESLKKCYETNRIGAFAGSLPPPIARAFETLLDPEARRAFDRERSRLLQERKLGVHESGESLEPVSLFQSFARVSPSLRGILDHLKENFRPRDPRIGSSQRCLKMEVLLTSHEAKKGGRIPVEIPCYRSCKACQGTGLVHLVPCHDCGGEGLLPGYSTLEIDYPACLADRAVIRRDLRHLGIFNLIVELQVRITEKIPRS